MPKNILPEETPGIRAEQTPELAELENGFASSDSDAPPDDTGVSGTPDDLMQVLDRIAQLKQDIMSRATSKK